jgi:glycosyltransferase involved in cell wall biosynthesis
MKVLSLFPSLDPAGGGIQSGGMALVLAGARAGVEHVVCCTERSGNRARSQLLIGELERAGVRVTTFPAVRRPAELADRWSVSVAQVPWIWSRVGEFDAVHIHGAWNIGALSGLAFARNKRIPIVVTSHESLTANDIDKSRSWPRRRQKLALKALYLRWTSLFVLTSELETNESLPAGTPHETIPYPLFDPGRPLADAPIRGTRDRLTIGYLGRIAPKKNLPIVIQALASLPEHVDLAIAGDGPAELVEPARRLAQELGVASRINWLGFVPPDRREEFLDHIDLLAMPSSFESFGMAAAEAMLAGVPLVVSRRTGISEVVARRGGGVVIGADAQELAAAVKALDADRARIAELSAQARAAIVHELDYDRIGASIRAAYARAVTAPPR